MYTDRDDIKEDIRRRLVKIKGITPEKAQRGSDAVMEYLDSLIERNPCKDVLDDPCYAFPWSLFDAAEEKRVEEIEITEDNGMYVFIVLDPDGGHCCGDPKCQDNGVDYNKIPDRFKTDEFNGVGLKRPTDA